MDTTAKVDIRKLQLLNDRIAQTIDALNQVRLSVHGLGLSHSAAGIPGMGVPFQSSVSPFQGSAYQASPYQAAAYGQQMFGSWPGVVPGLSHSNPWNQQAYAQSSGFGQSHVGSGLAGMYGQQQMNPLLSQLLWQQGIGGLSHSNEGVGYGSVGYPYHAGGYSSGVGVDPITASRIMQMFPFAQMPISPVG